jgi:hypothetical protein
MHWRLRLRGFEAPAPKGIAVLDPGVEELTLRQGPPELLMNLRLNANIGISSS